MSQYDASQKYPNSELLTNIESIGDEFLSKLDSFFSKRENLTSPKMKFPPMPEEEVKIPELPNALQVRRNMRKIVFSSLEEVQEADSHNLEDIGEVNFLL